MTKFFSFLLTICFAGLSAQSTFQKNLVINGMLDQTFQDMQTTSDGGFLICSYNTDFNFNYNSFLTKVNASGTVVWSEQLSMPNESCLIYTAGEKMGGGYYCFGMIGALDSMFGSMNFFLSALNSSGGLLWTKTFQSASGYLMSYASPRVKQLPNGDFAVSMNLFESMGILRIDANGNLLWGKEFYDDPSKNPSFDVLPTPDGGFVSCGKRDSDKMFVKTDANGNVLWSKIFTETNYSYNHPKSMLASSDGNLISAGMEQDLMGNTHGYIMKMDNSGTPIWYKTYSEGTNFFYFKEILELSNGHLALLGIDEYSFSPVMVITDANGMLISSEIITSGVGYYNNFSLHKSANDDLLLAYQSDGAEIRLFKSNWVSMLWCDKSAYPLTENTINYSPNVSSSLTQVNSGTEGTATLSVSGATAQTSNYCTTSGISVTETSGLSIYPNPAIGSFNLSTNGDGELKLFNSLTQEVGIWNLNSGSNLIDVATLGQGVYFFTFAESGKGLVTGKIALQK